LTASGIGPDKFDNPFTVTAVRTGGKLVLFDTGFGGNDAPRFFDRVIAEKGMIAGYHFGFPNVGTLSKDGDGYAFAPVKA
jgi:hypothetical protein